jgi:hypothetical protein
VKRPGFSGAFLFCARRVVQAGPAGRCRYSRLCTGGIATEEFSAVDEDVVPVVSVSAGDLSAAFSFGGSAGFGFAAILGAVAGLPATGGRADGGAASGLAHR